MAKLPGRFTPLGGFYSTATDGSNTLVDLTLDLISGTKLPGSFAPDGSLYVVATDGDGNLTPVAGSAALSVAKGTYIITGQSVSFHKTLSSSIDLGTYVITGQTVTLTYTPISSDNPIIDQSSDPIIDQSSVQIIAQ